MKKFKFHVMLSCFAILLPAAAAILLPAPAGMGAHLRSFSWALGGMVLGQLVGVWFTLRDPGNQGRNQKPMLLVLWILPIVANLCFALTYGLSMGWTFDPSALFITPLGLLFAAVGNYLPKVKMNSTMGIKISWAYTSEENWNATHRFAGKLWFAGGFAVAAASLLPLGVSVPAVLGIFLVMTLLPMAYSYRFYQKQKARGDDLKPFPKVFVSKKSAAVSAGALAVTLGITGLLMFAGEIRYTLEDDRVCIEADFYSDDVLNYSDIDALEFREGNVPGTRTGGYGSFRLLMGFFRNEEFGTYVRYTYYQPEACIVVTAGNNTLVLSAETARQTQALYEALAQRIQ